MGRLRAFFHAPGAAAAHGSRGAPPPRWGRILAELVDGGFGTVAELGRCTQRQLQLFHDQLTALRNRQQADRIEAVAIGYGGVKTKDGLKAMQRQLDVLRAE